MGGGIVSQPIHCSYVLFSSSTSIYFDVIVIGFGLVSRATCNAGGHRGVGCLRRHALAGMIDGLDLG
jgi:hypothetical protein